MGFPGNPKTKKVSTTLNKAETIAYYLETCYPNRYMLFNLAEETYDTYLFHDHVGFPPSPLQHLGGEL